MRMAYYFSQPRTLHPLSLSIKIRSFTGFMTLPDIVQVIFDVFAK